VSDPHRLDPDHLPTPFTAAQIRDGSPEGRTVRVVVDPAEDGTPYARVSRFTGCTEDGCTLLRWREGADGEQVGEAASGPVSWLDLQRHASFPAAVATRRREPLDHPLGPALDCWRYDVRHGEDVTTFWFAVEVPGMPVRIDSVAQGRLTERVTMVRAG